MSRGQVLVLALMVASVLVTAVAVVHAKYRSRQLFLEQQELAQQRDAVDIEWGRLQLELGTWGTHARVEREARSRLHMRLPRPENVVVLRH